MLLDLSLEVDATNLPNDRPAHAMGHVGTHFDVMEGRFPLESFKTRGRLIDISHIKDREVEMDDLADEVEADEMVIFHTGHVDSLGYGSKTYNLRSAELSDTVVHYLVDRKVRLIGVDAAGAQKPKKHVALDNFCASHGIFIIENLANTARLRDEAKQGFTVYTLPISYRGLTGLPCRVLAEYAG